MEMKLLERHNIDWALLPIGGHYTMDVDDAIIAAEFVNCKNVMGIHYDSFPPIKINHEEAVKKFNEADVYLALPKIGESIEI
jgi:L-ascorbate metabolism protein UlaG (beta-lactamase superfamily)